MKLNKLIFMAFFCFFFLGCSATNTQKQVIKGLENAKLEPINSSETIEKISNDKNF